MKIELTTYQGFGAYRLSTDGWEAVCVPELGGNIPWFVHLATGRQWLWVNPRVPVGPHDYGCSYGWGSAAGIDECFPAIAEGSYPLEPYQGVIIPDHGDVWTLPWNTQVGDGRLLMAVEGPSLPYRLERTLCETGDGAGLLFGYRLVNLGDAPFAYCWSSHPVCAASPGMVVMAQPDAPFQVYQSRTGRFGPKGTRRPWHSPSDADPSIIPACESPVRQGDKLFLENVTRNWAALYHPETDSHLRFGYDVNEINTVGVWMNLCESPANDHIAIEPCKGNYDALEECLSAGTASSLPPRGEHRWSWSLTPGLGMCET